MGAVLTENEARQLQHDMKQELNAAPVVVLKSAAMLLLITGLAWTGAGTEDPAGRDSPSPATSGIAEAKSYSKTVFETRRQRYIEAYPDSHVARDAAARIAKPGSDQT